MGFSKDKRILLKEFESKLSRLTSKDLIKITNIIVHDFSPQHMFDALKKEMNQEFDRDEYVTQLRALYLEMHYFWDNYLSPLDEIKNPNIRY